MELINCLISQPTIYETIEINEIDLLHGCAQLSDVENQELMEIIFKYIIDTKRFS